MGDKSCTRENEKSLDDSPLELTTPELQSEQNAKSSSLRVLNWNYYLEVTEVNVLIVISMEILYLCVERTNITIKIDENKGFGCRC